MAESFLLLRIVIYFFPPLISVHNEELSLHSSVQEVYIN